MFKVASWVLFVIWITTLRLKHFHTKSALISIVFSKALGRSLVVRRFLSKKNPAAVEKNGFLIITVQSPSVI